MKPENNIILSVTGLGYVGLPLALEFAKKFTVIGFDINESRVALMKQGIDPSNELGAEAFANTNIIFTSDSEVAREANFHIIGVPTDIDKNKVPNLNPLLSASKSIGKILKKGDTVVYESTVYPGCTEEDCVPVLEKHSGLKAGTDFHFGYSPERIVPGDKVKTVTKILKIVSGNSPEALKKIAAVYGSIIEAVVSKIGEVQRVYLIGDYTKGFDSGAIEVVIEGPFINLNYLEHLKPKIENEIQKTITFHTTKQYEGDGLLVFEQE